MLKESKELLKSYIKGKNLKSLNDAADREDNWKGFTIEDIPNLSLIGILSDISVVLAGNRHFCCIDL